MKGAEGLLIGSGSAPCHSDVLLPKLQARKPASYRISPPQSTPHERVIPGTFSPKGMPNLPRR